MHIDEEAFNRLRRYLESVKSSLGETQGADEIIRDVEARLVEIFQDRMGTEREVVLLTDVEAAISILGQPEDYRVDDEPQGKTNQEEDFRPKKRIFRNPDDKVIGGVAGGLAAYLGIDPIWLRLILVILLFTGSAFLIYIVLWIVMPEAKTTAQKLQMKGEAVNLSSIEKSIREELKKAGRSVNKAAEDIRQLSLGERLTHFAQNAVDLILSLAKLIIRSVLKIIGVGLVVFGVFLIISLTIGLFWGDIYMNGETYTTADGLLFIKEFINNSAVYYSTLIGVMMVTVIPSLFIIAIVIRYLFKLPKLNPLIFRSTAGIVLIGFVLLIFSGVRFARNFHDRGHIEDVVMVETLGKHHEMLVMDVPEGEELINIEVNNHRKRWIMGDDIRHFGLVEFDVERTNSDAAFIELQTSARGRSASDARFHAKKANFILEQEDSIVRFPLYYSLQKDESFRFQDIEVTFKLPVGHTIYLDEKFDGVMQYLGNVNDMYTHEMLGHTWLMTDQGLKCTDCLETDQQKDVDEWEELKDIPEQK